MSSFCMAYSQARIKSQDQSSFGALASTQSLFHVPESRLVEQLETVAQLEEQVRASSRLRNNTQRT